MKDDQFTKLLAFLERLDRAKISYTMEHSRDDAIMVVAGVPGEYWEIEFLQNGEIEVERFRSNGRIDDASLLDVLFAKFSADSPEPTPEEIRHYQESFFQ